MNFVDSVKKYAVAYYRISRIKTIVKDFFWVLVVLGLIATTPYFSLNLVLAALASLLILLYTFIINDCEDAEDDAKDPKKVNRNPISAKFITYNEGLWIARITAGLTVLISLFIGGWIPFFVVATALVVGHFYSSKVIRFKALPIIDVVSHAFFLSGAHIVLYFTLPGASITVGSWFIAAGASVFSAGGDLYNEYRDYEVDRATNLFNSAKLLGKTWTWRMARIYYIVGGLLVVIGVVERFGVIRF